MKLLLINPPETALITADNPDFLDEERGAHPPLGILYVAAIARQQPGWTVEVIDCVGERLSYAALAPRIKAANADLVGICVLTFTVFDVLSTIRVVRESSPSSKIVLGGPHTHIFPTETIGWNGVDIVAVGEGEAVIPGLLAAFPDKAKLKSFRGLVFRDHSGTIVNTGKVPLIEDLDAIPFPARDLTDINLYSSIMSKRNPISTMITSRGCPFKCSFCDRPNMGKRFRAHSAAYVLKELHECAKMGIRELLIYDDTFTVKRDRVFEICQKMASADLDLRFDIRARVDTVDEPMLQALKKAGCERIHYGVEAGTEKIQRVLQKGISLERAQQAFKLTKKLGIKTLAYFMIGSPTETVEDIRESIRFAVKLDPDFLSVTILTPFPETELYFQALKEGVISSDYFRDFAKNPTPNFKVKYWERELTRDVLFDELKRAYRSFYGRPAFIVRNILQLRSMSELKQKVKAGMKVLGLSGKS